MIRKAAVIGCGRMGALPASVSRPDVPMGWLPISHVESLLSIKGIAELALCDSDVAALKRWSDFYRLPAAYTEYKRLIEEFKPDLVSIATRTPIKKSIMDHACSHGVRAIYVEKPIANSIEQCKEILAKVEKTGVTLAYGVNRRYHPLYRQAKQMLKGGDIGELLGITIEFGESQLFWSHPHSVDLILYYADSIKVETASASLKPDTFELKSERLIDSDPIVETANFRFENGITGSIERGSGMNVRLQGTQGNLIIHGNGAFLQIDRKSHPQSSYFLKHEFIQPTPSAGATVTAFTELIESLETGAPTSITSREIEMNTRMLLGCAWSHLIKGRPVPLSEIPPDLVITGKFGDRYA